MEFIAGDNGCDLALQAAKELEHMADQIITPRDSPSAVRMRRQAANIRTLVHEFERLRFAVHPGLAQFEPTEEKPQEDFHILVAEGLWDCFKQHAELLAVCKALRDRLNAFIGATAEISDCSDDMAAVIVADEVIRKAEGPQ